MAERGVYSTSTSASSCKLPAEPDTILVCRAITRRELRVDGAGHASECIVLERPSRRLGSSSSWYPMPLPLRMAANADELGNASAGPAGADGRDYLGTSLAQNRWGREEIGRVAPGYHADIIAVDGDPLADIRAITRVELW